LPGLHLDGDLGDAVTTSPSDEQRFEGVTEIVMWEVVGEGTEQWLAYRPEPRRRITDGQPAVAPQRRR
jgi:hypothetical protein